MNKPLENVLTRRLFLESAAVFGAAAFSSFCLPARAKALEAESQKTGAGVEELVASPDPDDSFGVDLNINVNTIDQYLHRADVAYRDMRMLDDPADFAAIGGNAELDFTLEGFRITPFPYFVTMPKLAVDGAYDGPCLFDVVWGEDNRSVVSAAPNYRDSVAILKELFPQHKNLFLMCGGGGYASMMRAFLLFMGWDPDKVFNVGGAWDYAGPSGVYLISYDANDRPTYRRWRADYALIEFDNLVPMNGEQVAQLHNGKTEAPAPHERARKCIVL